MEEVTQTHSSQIVDGIISRYNLTPQAGKILLENMNRLINAAIVTDFCTDKKYHWNMTTYEFDIERKKPYVYKSPEYRRAHKRVKIK